MKKKLPICAVSSPTEAVLLLVPWAALPSMLVLPNNHPRLSAWETMCLELSWPARVARLDLHRLLPLLRSNSHRNIRCPAHRFLKGPLPLPRHHRSSQVFNSSILRVPVDLAGSLPSHRRRLPRPGLAREGALADLLRAVQPLRRSTRRCRIPVQDNRLKSQLIRLQTMGACNHTHLHPNKSRPIL